MELSEIFFYGFRKDAGRKLLVYGAGREKQIAAFGEYEPLEELMCRLTQAGPVFLVREENSDYEVKGFQVFYADNEAMQRYLIERKQNGKKESGEKPAALLPPTPLEEAKKKTSHGAMSLQLGLILVLLVAIVISSTNSYDKMEQLNRSAREVFFAIENQEAEKPEEVSEDFERQSKIETEIVVERDEVAVKRQEGGKQEAKTTETEDVPEEGILKSTSGAAESTAQRDEPAEETSEDKEEEEQEEKEEQTQAAETQSDEENTEALSRSVTRYYEVEKGDTLYTISQKIYGDTSRVERICELNEIADPDRIRSGQKIILP